MDPLILVILSKAGMFFGLAGAFLVATRTKYSSWGFVGYLLSNLAWIPFGFQKDIDDLSYQHIGFIACSLLGIYRYRQGLMRSKTVDGEAP